MSDIQGQAAAAAEAVTQNADQSGDGQNPGAGTPASQESAGLTKEQAREAIRKLKIDDQEVDETEVIKVFKERKGHQQAANKILQEGKTAKKQAEAFLSMLKDKGQLLDVMKKLGHDPRALAEEVLASHLEDEMLDPREKELREAKRKLQEYEQLTKKQKDDQERKFAEQMKAKFSENYTKQFTEALKSEGLPPTKGTVAEMAKYIARAAKLKFEMTAKEAAQLVKEDIEAANRNLFGEADAETIVRLLGESGLQKIRAYEVSKIKDPNAGLKTPTEQPELGKRVQPAGKRMSTAEWRAFNRK